MITYLDASAVLRILFDEPGLRVPRNRAEVFSSQIVRVETFRAVERAQLSGRIDPALRVRKTKELTDLLTAISMVPLSEEIVSSASHPFGIPVRALDALHVASALFLQTEAGDPVEFWTHDALQARAATVRALAVQGLSSDG